MLVCIKYCETDDVCMTNGLLTALQMETNGFSRGRMTLAQPSPANPALHGLAYIARLSDV
jgi:hypothetical protein